MTGTIGSPRLRRLLRWSALPLSVLVGLPLLGAGLVWLGSELVFARTYPRSPEPMRVQATAEMINEGRRRADIFGCTSCHGAELHGRRMWDEPGAYLIQSSNLTRASRRYSDEQLAQAIRQGVRHDGRALWGMPSEMFSRMNDEETAAVIAYIRSRPADGPERPAPRWWLPGRLQVIRGQFKPEPAYVAEARTKLPLAAGPDHAAGRHIAASVCSECHGPDLAGDGKGTPDLAIAAAYDPADFHRLMRTGKAAGDRELRMMSGVARDRFSRFTDAEVEALHAYLKARAALKSG